MPSPSEALASSIVRVAVSTVLSVLELMVPVPVSVAVTPEGASETLTGPR